MTPSSKAVFTTSGYAFFTQTMLATLADTCSIL